MEQFANFAIILDFIYWVQRFSRFRSKTFDRLLDQVYVGAVFCGQVIYKAGTSKYEIECGGAIGGSIEVRQPYNYLTLCEVKAYGEPSDETPLKNVADGRLSSAC